MDTPGDAPPLTDTGPVLQIQVVPWMLISDEASMLAFADAIARAPRQLFCGGTSISGAIDHAMTLFPATEIRGARRVIRILFPPVDLFEDIAAPEDWPLLIAAEQKTNPRLMAIEEGGGTASNFAENFSSASPPHRLAVVVSQAPPCWRAMKP